MTRHHPWVGAAFGQTSLHRAREISGAWEQELSGAEPPPPKLHPTVDSPQLRPIVTSSWGRSRRAGVDPEGSDPPGSAGSEDPLDRWSVHPLHPFVEVVESMLGSFAYDAGHIVVVADRDGCLLWSMGHPKVLAASESIAFTPGRVWSEEAVGTNGVGTALAVGHPVQIFASEHYTRPVHAWVCSGAPVHDPATGEVLGVIDVSSGIRAAHPYSLAMVSATARMVETLLASGRAVALERCKARFFELVAQRRGGARALLDAHGRILASHPPGWLQRPFADVGSGRLVTPGGAILAAEPFGDGTVLVSPNTGARGSAVPSTLRLRARPGGRLALALEGAEEAAVAGDTLSAEDAAIAGDTPSAEITLTRRRSQLLALLALAPDGLRGPELAHALYGPGDHEVTLRAEISRLRRDLGGLIATSPYRLIAPVSADAAVLAEVATRLQP